MNILSFEPIKSPHFPHLLLLLLYSICSSTFNSCEEEAFSKCLYDLNFVTGCVIRKDLY